MRKRKALPNLIGIILAVIIMAAGIIIPINLLNGQEQRIIGKSYNAAMDSHNLVSMGSIEPNPTPGPVPIPIDGKLDSGMSVDELFAYLSAWNINGYASFREPSADELSMEQAMAYVKRTIQGFIDIGAFPAGLWEEYRFVDAQLSANVIPAADNEASIIIGGVTLPTNIGRWIISFESKTHEGKITVDCDAITGTIYEVRIMDHNMSEISHDTILNAFAAYFKLSDDGWSTDKSQDTNSISSDRFVLSYHSEDANSYTISLNVRNYN